MFTRLCFSVGLKFFQRQIHGEGYLWALLHVCSRSGHEACGPLAKAAEGPCPPGTPPVGGGETPGVIGSSCTVSSRGGDLGALVGEGSCLQNRGPGEAPLPASEKGTCEVRLRRRGDSPHTVPGIPACLLGRRADAMARSTEHPAGSAIRTSTSGPLHPPRAAW